MEKNRILDVSFWKNSKSFFEHFNQQTALIIEIFTEVSNAFPQNKLESFFQNAKGCKISKGNQLNGLPYQVLDVIRDFDPKDGFNIRLLNWWGNDFYVFITYGSETAEKFQKEISSSFHDFYLSKSALPYQYEKVLTENEVLSNKTLCKELENPKQIQIWKKLNISENTSVTKNYLEKMIQRILDIHN
jgi:hypothetical protein